MISKLTGGVFILLSIGIGLICVWVILLNVALLITFPDTYAIGYRFVTGGAFCSIGFFISYKLFKAGRKRRKRQPV